MPELADAADWKACLDVRVRQRVWGAVCALLLAFALLALVDGLQGMARNGSDVLELLPGDSVSLSGPLTIKNPVNNDLSARFTPPNSLLTYELEGFFSGYWFGNGMIIAVLNSRLSSFNRVMRWRRLPWEPYCTCSLAWRWA